MLVIHQFLVTAFDESPLKSNIRGCFFDRFTGTKLSVVWPICCRIGLYFLQCIPQQCSPPTKGSISVWMPFMLAWRLKRNFVAFTRCCWFLERIDALTLWKKWYWRGPPESKLASRTILNLRRRLPSTVVLCSGWQSDNELEGNGSKCQSYLRQYVRRQAGTM